MMPPDPAPAAAAEPTLDQIERALTQSSRRESREVLDAFLPMSTTLILGHPLVDITLGHSLILQRLGHPLATLEHWHPADFPLALYLFTRPSDESAVQLRDGTLPASFHAFSASLPLHDPAEAGRALIAHWEAAWATGLAMRAPASHGVTATRKNVMGSTAMMLATATTEFGWTTQHTIHREPLARLLVLLAASSYSAGMEPTGGGYTDLEFERTLAEIRAADPTPPPAPEPPPAAE